MVDEPSFDIEDLDFEKVISHLKNKGDRTHDGFTDLVSIYLFGVFNHSVKDKEYCKRVVSILIDIGLIVKSSHNGSTQLYKVKYEIHN